MANRAIKQSIAGKILGIKIKIKINITTKDSQDGATTATRLDIKRRTASKRNEMRKKRKDQVTERILLQVKKAIRYF